MNCHQKTSLKSLIDFKYLNFSNFSSPAEVKQGKVWAFLVVFPGSFEKIAAQQHQTTFFFQISQSFSFYSQCAIKKENLGINMILKQPVLLWLNLQLYPKSFGYILKNLQLSKKSNVTIKRNRSRVSCYSNMRQLPQYGSIDLWKLIWEAHAQ